MRFLFRKLKLPTHLPWLCRYEINNLSRENANLMAQIGGEGRRINGLRDDLAGTARNPK